MIIKKHIYQFKIELKIIEPAIWRRIVVPATYSFWDLHVAIQDAMGWLDSHLHSFRMTRGARRTRKEFGIPDDDDRWPGMPVTLADWEVPIAAWFTSPGHEALYTYDFGDDWRHVVRLGAGAPAEGGGKGTRPRGGGGGLCLRGTLRRSGVDVCRRGTLVVVGVPWG